MPQNFPHQLSASEQPETLESLRAKRDEIERIIDAAMAEKHRLNAEMDVLIIAKESERPSPAEEYSAYLAAQGGQQRARAEQRKATLAAIAGCPAAAETTLVKAPSNRFFHFRCTVRIVPSVLFIIGPSSAENNMAR